MTKFFEFENELTFKMILLTFLYIVNKLIMAKFFEFRTILIFKTAQSSFKKICKNILTNFFEFENALIFKMM